MRPSTIYLFSLASLAIGSPIAGSQDVSISKRWWGQIQPHTVSGKIDTIVKDLHVVQNAASSFTGGWYESYQLMNDVNDLTKALNEASAAADKADALSQGESADVMTSLTQFSPEMVKIMAALGDQKEVIQASAFESRIESSIKDLCDTNMHFFDIIKEKLSGEDKQVVQELQDATHRQFITAEEEIEE